MTHHPQTSITLELLKPLLLQLSAERSTEALLKNIVIHLAGLPAVALARIWLVQPGDICDVCHFRYECPNRESCLHLVASDGQSQLDPDQKWDYLEGSFQRFPLGVRKVGRVAATGEPIEVNDILRDDSWIANKAWAAEEGIRSFVGQPLIFKGQTLGVLGVFQRTPLISTDDHLWLRMVADQAAAAISNARAFEEIELLKNRLELENEFLKEEVQEFQAFGSIVGQSPALRNTLSQVELVAQTDANVLILGESGTGKELIAREIHNRSPRAKGPMVKVNCASIPRELYESEFFGHVKGAFTGAIRDRAGRFEAAHGGTLFLDEVGEIPLALQGKLLRVLQEGQYERVGEEKTCNVDVRIVAATNRDLKKEVDEGNFRSDLYFRLNVFPVELAPLRDRREDIPLLATHFLKTIAWRLNRAMPRLTQANVIDLQAYPWPGNIRELQNIIERAIITSKYNVLRFELPERETKKPVRSLAPNPERENYLTDEQVREFEKRNLESALNATAWKVYGPGGAAQALGIKPTTLISRMKKPGLSRPQP